MKPTLYYGGTILTMTPAPAPEAILVGGDGRIAALGGRDELESLAPDAERICLDGAALMPAFIDPHSHFSNVASSLLQLRLENVLSFAELQARVKDYIAAHHLAPGQWVNASGYDHTRLAEGRHPDRALLDAAAPQNPVVLQHASGHVGVLNTAALRALDVTAKTPVPPGGEIALDAGGQPTGYLAEGAFVACLKRVPPPDIAALLAAFDRAQEIYAANGIATVQEGLMVEGMQPLYRALLQSGKLRLDVVGYPEADAADAYHRDFAAHEHRYRGHFKIGGRKLLLDGSPQARTAWLSRPYLGCTPAEEPTCPDSGYCGRGSMNPAAVVEAVARAAADGMQILAHCNGDAAAQEFLDACMAVARRDPRLRELRPVMIHAQLLRPDQLPEVRALGMIPSFFVAHVYHWGDLHLRNFGVERAAHISPAGSALRAGIPFTFHQDAPVLPPDMLETVWCAVNRLTAAGLLLGPEERIPAADALRAVTVNAARQYFEEGEKGALAPGMRADLTILSKDPLAVPPAELRGIRVLATIKDGVCIWTA